MVGALAASAGAVHSASIGGVYALGKLGQPTPEAVLNDPDVDGLALRYSWTQLEPGDGEFMWSNLDHEFAAAREHGKKVSLIVMPGMMTPQWVYAAGARSYIFASCQAQVGGPSPAGRQVPIPWDPIFLAKWTGFVSALGARYGGNPALSMIKVTGINAVSAELAISRHGSCEEVDTRNWQNAGYTRQKIVQAYGTILNAFARAFPTTKLCLMTVPRPLPPLDSNGQRLVNHVGDRQGTQQLISTGIDEYSSRFVLQNNGLSAFWNWEKIPEVRSRIPVGYQMLWSATNDPQCRMNHGQFPCDPRTVLQAAVNRGIDSGASYLEIYIPDILNPACRQVIAQAHARLAHAS